MRRESEPAQPRNLPSFRLRQWALVLALCGAALWAGKNRDRQTEPEFESISMARAEADYYLETFEILHTDNTGNTSFALRAESLIHHPDTAVAVVTNPSLDVPQGETSTSRWQLKARRGSIPDDGIALTLEDTVELQFLDATQPPVTLNTPSLTLDRQRMAFSTDSGVRVRGLGWQIRADKMTGLVNTGQLIFRDNNHVQYAPQLR